jgi:ABC-2 type transport system permease protein
VNAALRTLLWRTARNRLKGQASDVRYISGWLLSALYLGWLASHPRPDAGTGARFADVTLVLGALLLLAVTAAAWWRAPTRLELSTADCQWLVPAPIHDRQLLWFSLARVQGRLVLTSLVLTAAGLRNLWPFMLLHFVALLTLLNTLELYRLAVAVVRAREAGNVVSARVVTLVARALFLATGALTLAAVARPLSRLATVTPRGLSELLVGAITNGPLGAALAPFTFVLRSALTHDGSEWLRSMAVLLVAMLTLGAWLASIRIEWRARTAVSRWRVSAAQSSGSRHGALRAGVLPKGIAEHPAMAIFAKNVRTAGRTQRLVPQLALVIGAPILLAFTSLRPLQPATEFACGVLSMWGALLVIAGPLFVRCDLRLDLPRLRLLRTMPITSMHLCAAGVAGSALILSVLQLGLLLLTALSLSFNPVVTIPQLLALMVLIVAALTVPAMNLAQVAAHTLAAVLWPQWSQLGVIDREKPGSVGRYYVSILVSAGAFALLALGPALIGLVVAGSVLPVTGSLLAAAAGGCAAAVVAVGESVVLTSLAARAFDALDVRHVQG